jgi:hypothetical protein
MGYIRAAMGEERKRERKSWDHRDVGGSLNTWGQPQPSAMDA